MQSHAGCLMVQLLESLKPIIAAGQVQKFMDNARHLKTESELACCQNHAMFSKPHFGAEATGNLPFIQANHRKLSPWIIFSK